MTPTPTPTPEAGTTLIPPVSINTRLETSNPLLLLVLLLGAAAIVVGIRTAQRKK